VDRIAWQMLAEERILAAQALQAAKYWSSAYYVAGYAVEFGLKSCILVHLAANPKVIFENKKYSVECWSHTIIDLLKMAGLHTVMKADVSANVILAQNWSTVIKWAPESRYEQKAQAEADELIKAIIDTPNGVMPWIRIRW